MAKLENICEIFTSFVISWTNFDRNLSKPQHRKFPRRNAQYYIFLRESVN